MAPKPNPKASPRKGRIRDAANPFADFVSARTKAPQPPVKARSVPTKSKAATRRKPAKHEWSPARLVAYDEGEYGLFFSCDAFEGIGAMALFEKAGAYGNGYGWESVMAPALEAADRTAAREIDYDSEGDTFCARCPSSPFAL
jgi:hypothetical protein